MKKILFILFTYINLSFSASAQDSSPATTRNTVGCVSGNCDNGDGVYHSSNGNLYEGSFARGKYQGKGKITYKDGDVYIGEFDTGKMNGHGLYTYHDGTIYDGAFLNGKMEGIGTA